MRGKRSWFCLSSLRLAPLHARPAANFAGGTFPPNFKTVCAIDQQGALRRRTPLFLTLEREGASLVVPSSGREVQAWRYVEDGLSATPNADSPDEITLTFKVNRSGVMKMIGRGEESKWVLSSPDRASLLASLLSLRDITVDDEAQEPRSFMCHYGLAGRYAMCAHSPQRAHSSMQANAAHARNRNGAR